MYFKTNANYKKDFPRHQANCICPETNMRKDIKCLRNRFGPFIFKSYSFFVQRYKANPEM